VKGLCPFTEGKEGKRGERLVWQKTSPANPPEKEKRGKKKRGDRLTSHTKKTSARLRDRGGGKKKNTSLC